TKRSRNRCPPLFQEFAGGPKETCQNAKVLRQLSHQLGLGSCKTVLSIQQEEDCRVTQVVFLELSIHAFLGEIDGGLGESHAGTAALHLASGIQNVQADLLFDRPSPKGVYPLAHGRIGQIGRRLVIADGKPEVQGKRINREAESERLIEGVA